MGSRAGVVRTSSKTSWSVILMNRFLKIETKQKLELNQFLKYNIN